MSDNKALADRLIGHAGMFAEHGGSQLHDDLMEAARLIALSPQGDASGQVDVGDLIAACSAYNDHVGRASKKTADPDAMRKAIAALSPAQARPDGGEVCWQRRVLLREGHWGQWEQYRDLYNEGRPEMVGRFKCEYRPLYTHPAPAPDAARLVDEEECKHCVDGIVPMMMNRDCPHCRHVIRRY